MATYYEMLKIAPSASTGEIQAAIDVQYDQWRRLVAHHNPEVVEQANQSLRVLETIRAILSDPAKRASYDASLNVGGLADPEAVMRAHGAPLPAPLKPAGSHAPASDQAVDAWICPQCGTSSPRGTRFCGTCSHQIGIECPKCSKLIFTNMVFCPECGVEVKPELALKSAREEAQKAEQARAQLTALQAQLQAKRTEVETLERLISSWQSWWSTKTPAKRQNLGCAANLAGLAIFLLSLMMFGGSAFLLRAVGISWDVGIWISLPIVMASALVGTIISQWYFGRPVIAKQIDAYRQQIAQIEKQVAQLQAQPARNE